VFLCLALGGLQHFFQAGHGLIAAGCGLGCLSRLIIRFLRGIFCVFHCFSPNIDSG
jgi:hypothetical protein